MPHESRTSTAGQEPRHLPLADCGSTNVSFRDEGTSDSAALGDQIKNATLIFDSRTTPVEVVALGREPTPVRYWGQ